MSAWLVETLVATTLLMALVLVARPFVRWLFGATAAYALWLVPALRLILPPIDGASAPAAALTTVPVEIVFAAAERTGGVGMWLLAVWAIGAMAFAGWHVAAYRRFLARALVKNGPGAGRGVQILYTDAVAGPAAVGLFRPRILLPIDFAARFAKAESALALRHEQVHHARGDLWANAAALVMLSLHWFNPLAYRAYRAFREDQEFSCDATVIAAASLEERAAYGAALVKSAQGIGWATPAAPSTICPMTRNHNLKRRLKMVRTHRKSALASAGGALVVGMTALAGLTLTATSGFAGEPGKAAEPVVKKVIVKRMSGADATKALSEAEVDTRCGGNAAKFEVAPTTDGAGKKTATKLILCRQDGTTATPAKQLSVLQAARAEMLKSTELDSTQRSRAVAAIDSAIATLQAAN